LQSLIEANPILMLAQLVCIFSQSFHLILNNNIIGHIDHGKTTLTAAITRYLSNKGKI
jgi:DNA replication protein DnaC